MATVVAVAGIGRSGTSLAMRALRSAGAQLSETLVPAYQHNPLGPLEDADIFRVSRRLLRQLGIHPRGLRPANWQIRDEYNLCKEELLKIVLRNLEATRRNKNTVWAFKTPDTSLLVPLWREVFRELNVTYRFVFCARQLDAALTSFLNFHSHYDILTAQFSYLKRVFYATDDMREDAYYLHYEDWQNNAASTFRAVASYCGLEAGTVSDELLDDVYQRNLNHYSGASQNCLGIVRELADALELVRGARPSLTPLEPVLSEIRNDFARLSGSIPAALGCPTSDDNHKLVAQCNDLRARLEELSFELTSRKLAHESDLRAAHDRHSELERKLRAAEAAKRSLVTRVKALSTKNDELMDFKSAMQSKFRHRLKHELGRTFPRGRRRWQKYPLNLLTLPIRMITAVFPRLAGRA